jgi:hypothetical protein
MFAPKRSSTQSRHSRRDAAVDPRNMELPITLPADHPLQLGNFTSAHLGTFESALTPFRLPVRLGSSGGSRFGDSPWPFSSNRPACVGQFARSRRGGPSHGMAGQRAGSRDSTGNHERAAISGVVDPGGAAHESRRYRVASTLGKVQLRGTRCSLRTCESGAYCSGGSHSRRLINSRSLVLELTLMVRRGYIFEKPYHISAMMPHFAKLMGKKAPCGSFAAHVLHSWCSPPSVQ